MAQVFEVPCGKCAACRIRRTAEWTKRILDESEGKETCFITLTYDDMNLPSDMSLHKEHLQKFWKRLRKSLTCKIKYYACGEYGEQTHRPHYHAIVIGWRPELEDLIYVSKNVLTSAKLQKLWPYGFNTVGTVTKESAQYVTGYIRKKIYGKENPYHPRTPPFSCSSTHLGFDYAEKNWTRILAGETVCGKNLGIPRYYLKNFASREQKNELMEKGIDKQYDIVKNYETLYEYEKALWSDRARRQADAASLDQILDSRKKV